MLKFNHYFVVKDMQYNKSYKVVLTDGLHGRYLTRTTKTATQAVAYGKRVADRYNRLFANR